MKYCSFIGLLLGLLFLGGEGARAATLRNYLPVPVMLEVAGTFDTTEGWTDFGNNLGPIYGPGFNFYGERSLAPGESVNIPQGSLFNVAGPNWEWPGPYVVGTYFYPESQGWWQGKATTGEILVGGAAWDEMRLLGDFEGLEIWQEWNSNQEDLYGSWSPPTSGDPNLAALVSALSTRPAVVVAMFMLGLVSAITAGVVLFGLWTFLHWFYLRLRGRDLA